MEFKVQIPDGMCIDEANSSFECIKFKPIEEDKCYKDIAVKLFLSKETYYHDTHGDISSFTPSNDVLSAEPNNCTSEKQVRKVLAINMLLNISRYLNKEWVPDWSCAAEYKYVFEIQDDKIRINSNATINKSIVYFKTRELAEQALKILGGYIVRLALSTDW